MRTSNRQTAGEVLAEKPFWLGLSAGFFGYFADLGAQQAILEYGLEPIGMSGSSGGALAVGVVASGLEPVEAAYKLYEINRKDFWDPGRGWGLLKGGLFGEILEELMPATCFEEAEVPTKISVLDIKSWKTEVIDDGDMTRAIRASCAFPGLFQPVYIEGRPKLDGGIKDHAGVEGIPVDEKVLHIDLSRNEPFNDPMRDMIQIHMPDLPRVNPLRLDRGIEAYKQAKTHTERILRQPLDIL